MAGDDVLVYRKSQASYALSEGHDGPLYMPRSRGVKRASANSFQPLYLIAMSGSTGAWALRATRAIIRPDPIISDPPTNIGMPGLSCQTK